MNGNHTLGDRVGQIHAETSRLAVIAWPLVVAYIVILSLGGVYVDQSTDFARPTLILNIATFILGFLLATKALRDGGLAPHGLGGGIGTYFALSLLSGLALLLGFVALVMPGIFLMVRWMPLYAFGLVRGEGFNGAFARSWQATEGHFGAIFVALLVPISLYLASFAMLFWGTDDAGLVRTIPSLIGNLGISLAGAITLLMGIAVYSLLRDQTETLTEVFD